MKWAEKPGVSCIFVPAPPDLFNWDRNRPALVRQLQSVLAYLVENIGQNGEKGSVLEYMIAVTFPL